MYLECLHMYLQSRHILDVLFNVYCIAFVQRLLTFKVSIRFTIYCSESKPHFILTGCYQSMTPMFCTFCKWYKFFKSVLINHKPQIIKYCMIICMFHDL